ncbi:hypothetical protein GCM10025776_30130 [Corallincola platygyrae]
MVKLGRCQACMVKSALFALVCLIALTVTPTSQQILWLTWCAGAFGFGALLLLHLLFALAYRLRGDKSTSDAGEPKQNH